MVLRCDVRLVAKAFQRCENVSVTGYLRRRTTTLSCRGRASELRTSRAVVAGRVSCSAWIRLMSSAVTGRSLSPMVKEIAGLLPVSTWKFQRARGVFATTMRDRGGPSSARTNRLSNHNMNYTSTETVTPRSNLQIGTERFLRRRRSRRQLHQRKLMRPDLVRPFGAAHPR